MENTALVSSVRQKYVSNQESSEKSNSLLPLISVISIVMGLGIWFKITLLNDKPASMDLPLHPIERVQNHDLATTQEKISSVAIAMQSFFLFLGHLAVGLRLQRDDQNISRQGQEGSLLSREFREKNHRNRAHSIRDVYLRKRLSGKLSKTPLPHVKDLAQRFSEMPQSHIAELNELAQRLSEMSSKEQSQFLKGIGGDQWKHWTASLETFEILMTHDGFNGLIFRFPKLSVMRPDQRKEYFSFYRQLSEWGGLLEGKYPQLVIPKSSIHETPSGGVVVISEVIEISSTAIGKDVEAALEQFTRFRAQIGYPDIDLNWGRSAGFVTSFIGKKQSPDKPARIALLDCGDLFRLPDYY